MISINEVDDNILKNIKKKNDTLKDKEISYI